MHKYCMFNKIDNFSYSEDGKVEELMEMQLGYIKLSEVLLKGHGSLDLSIKHTWKILAVGDKRPHIKL